MPVRIAINGFGRIGRLVLRAVQEMDYKDVEIAAINELGPVATNAHLLQFDSVHGRFPGKITSGDNWIDAGGGKIAVSAERDPVQLPWRKLGIDMVFECTGKFTKPRAGRLRPAQGDRHRTRLYDDDPCLHRRSKHR